MNPTAQMTGRLRRSDLADAALLAVACFAGAWVGRFSGPEMVPLSLLWPPAGLALAALLLLGGRHLAAAAGLGVLAALFAAGEHPAVALAVAAGTATSSLVAAWLLERKAGFSPRLERPRHMLSLIGIGAFLAPVISATAYAIGKLASGVTALELLAAIWALWWARDALSVALLAPLVLTWAAAGTPASRSARNLESIGLALLQVLVYVYVFVSQSGPDAYLCLPLSLLAALYLGLRWVAAANLVTFLIAALGTSAGLGPFAQAPGDSLLQLQTFAIITGLTTLLTACLATERRRAVFEHRDAHRFLDTLIDTFPTPILVKDSEHRYIAANSAFCRFFRRSTAEIIGKTDADFFSAEDTAWFQETDRKALEGAVPVEYERPYSIDGQVSWMLVRKTRLARPDGSRVVVLLLLDVTERKAAEERLRASEQRFRSLTELSADWYWEQDAQLRFTYLAPGEQGRTALPIPELLGKSRFELDIDWESEASRQEHMDTLRARRPFRDLLVRDRRSGRWIMISGEPVFDAHGEFSGYRGVARDVSRLKLAEAELAESGKFLDALISAVPTPVTVKDSDHRFVHVNDAFCQLAGRGREELIGADDSTVLSPEEVEFAWRLDRETLASDRPVQYEHACVLGGQPRWLLVRKCVLSRPDGSQVIVSSLIDISNLKAVEAALRASEARLRSLLELSADWMWEQDAQFRYTFLSAEAPSKGGMEPDRAIGKALPELAFRWESEEQKRAHMDDLEVRRTFRDLHLMRVEPEGRTRHISVSGEPMFGPRGEFLGYRGTGQDITERKLTERRVARLKDMYAAMTEANDAIIHTKDTTQLFAAICRMAVAYGHFVFARIALIDHQTGWVQTVASAGEHKGYADRFVVSIDASRPEGQGPAAHAIRTACNYVCNDITGDPRNRPWLEIYDALGVRAQATFLLHRQGRVTGTLNLYADQTGFFDDELVGMLEKLAANLSFALDNLQREDARRAAEAALRESETRFRDFADAAGEYVWEADAEGRYTYVSSRVLSVWSYSDQELIGHTPFDFMPPGEAERVREWLAQNVRPDGSFRDLEHRILTRNADTRWLLVNAVGILDQKGKLVGQRGTGRDITDRKTAEARISYLATRDPLTELPNRVLFNDRLEQGIVAARRSRQSLALLFIDLDRFKYINDSLGHQVGDLLLKEVAARMVGCIRKGDTLSRLGGDEFVVTLEGLQHAEDAAQVANKIIKALARPFEIAGHTLSTSCSIGIATFPLDAEDDRTLMKNADTAMYHAKERGRNNYQFFSPEMNVRAVERHNLETALRLAIERGEFVLHFQPQVDIRTSRVVGMEALLRWQHPERGLLGPATFIGVAEESGLIEPIGQWVLRSACQRGKAWQDAGYPPVRIAVNISPRQLNNPREFSRGLSRVLNATGLDPRFLELEMTESLLLQNAEENIAILRKLQDGVRIAVDDFGTGYSSLSYLRQLPIDTLKIDRSFVRDIETDPEDAAIIEAVVAMAHSLKLQVTAEGVETRGQLEKLARLGCDQYQGYLFSKPLPAIDAAAKFLAPHQLDLRVSNTPHASTDRAAAKLQPRRARRTRRKSEKILS